MKGFSRQKEFSNLYDSISTSNEETNIGEAKNPFDVITYYIHENNKLPKSDNFKKNLVYLMEIKEHLEHAFNCFEVEFHLLQTGKAEYLNQNIDFIQKHYKQAKEFSPILSTELFKTLGKCCEHPYANYINNTNRKDLSKRFDIPEPITSFLSKKPLMESWFQSRLWNRSIYRFEEVFIDKETSASTYKALFEGVYMENKINWLDTKSSLCYFIKELIASKVIVNPRNKHWEIVSEFFLIKGEPIKQSSLRSQKVISDTQKREVIDRFIQDLVYLNS